MNQDSKQTKKNREMRTEVTQEKEIVPIDIKNLNINIIYIYGSKQHSKQDVVNLQ